MQGIILMFSKKIGHQRWQIFTAIALQTACVGAMSTVSIDNPVKSIILTCIISVCSGIVILGSLVLICFGILSQDDIGTAAGLAGTARLLFGGVAIAIFGNVSTNKYKTEIPVHVRANVANLNVPASSMKALIAAAGANTAAAYSKVPNLTPQIRAAAVLANKEAYVDGARLAYLVALAFGLVGCLCALCLESIDTRKYTKNTVALQEKDREALEERFQQDLQQFRYRLVKEYRSRSGPDFPG
jgi:hypothetical protein